MTQIVRLVVWQYLEIRNTWQAWQHSPHLLFWWVVDWDGRDFIDLQLGIGKLHTWEFLAPFVLLVTNRQGPGLVRVGCFEDEIGWWMDVGGTPLEDEQFIARLNHCHEAYLGGFITPGLENVVNVISPQNHFLTVLVVASLRYFNSADIDPTVGQASHDLIWTRLTKEKCEMVINPLALQLKNMRVRGDTKWDEKINVSAATKIIPRNANYACNTILGNLPMTDCQRAPFAFIDQKRRRQRFWKTKAPICYYGRVQGEIFYHVGDFLSSRGSAFCKVRQWPWASHQLELALGLVSRFEDGEVDGWSHHAASISEYIWNCHTWARSIFRPGKVDMYTGEWFRVIKEISGNARFNIVPKFLKKLSELINGCIYHSKEIRGRKIYIKFSLGSPSCFVLALTTNSGLRTSIGRWSNSFIFYFNFLKYSHPVIRDSNVRFSPGSSLVWLRYGLSSSSNKPPVEI